MRIRSKSDHDQIYDVLDTGERFYIIAGTDFLPVSVPKDEFEVVPEPAPGWVDVTETVTLDAAKTSGKVSLFMGHKRIGYVLMHPPYRLRLNGDRVVVEQQDEL